MSSRTSPELALPPSQPESLRDRLRELESQNGMRALAVCVHDEETGFAFDYHGDRWFHAASTIKVAILLGVFAAVHRGALVPQSRLHVRNRFFSAYDGAPYRIAADRDSDDEVQDAVGKTMRVDELARHMIAVSSNLATNLLLDLVGVENVRRTLDAFDLRGIDLRRGVEDERAFEHGISNRVTAEGLVALLRLIAEERAFTPALSREMLDILHQQEFKKGIPARLPPGTRVAHKTGDISTVAHDAGVVYLPARRPYVLAVLTEWAPDEGAGRRATSIAAVSYAVYRHILGATTERDA